MEGLGTIIFSNKCVRIGNNTSIAGQTYIIDSNHGISKSAIIQEQPLESDPNGISIGADVWIGAQCMIMKGAQIEDHAVIGCQSMVNSVIPQNAIAFGTPAKIHGFRQ